MAVPSARGSLLYFSVFFAVYFAVIAQGVREIVVFREATAFNAMIPGPLRANACLWFPTIVILGRKVDICGVYWLLLYPSSLGNKTTPRPGVRIVRIHFELF